MADEPRRFQIGDLVMLKSGGPVLTVTEVIGEEASCHWFDANMALHTGELPIVCLALWRSIEDQQARGPILVISALDEDGPELAARRAAVLEARILTAGKVPTEEQARFIAIHRELAQAMFEWREKHRPKAAVPARGSEESGHALNG